MPRSTSTSAMANPSHSSSRTRARRAAPCASRVEASLRKATAWALVCCLAASAVPMGTALAQSATRSAEASSTTSSTTSAAQSTVLSEARGATARPGWYVGLQLAAAALHIDASNLPVTGVRLDPIGSGVQVSAGYAFSTAFALELSLLGTRYGTDQSGIDAGCAQLTLDAVAHLSEGSRLQPYVAGGLGGVVVALQGTQLEEASLRGGQVDVGGGLEGFVSRHFALALEYRYSIQSYQKQVTGAGGLSLSRDIVGEGHAHSWGLRCVYSF